MIYTKLTNQALRLCFELHKNQKDKSNVPYVFHPFHLAEQMDDEISTCTALLHDIVEDTDATLDDLRNAGFPDKVVDAVAVLTHDPSLPYFDYIEKIKTNPIAIKVKLADLAHNSDPSRCEIIDSKMEERYAKYKKAIAVLEDHVYQKHRDKIRGCLIAGAAGDALGYPVEFKGEKSIFALYGKSGITEYDIDSQTKKAVVSDDTQMTLFTAEGLLEWARNRKIGLPAHFVNLAYQDWLLTQSVSYKESSELKFSFDDLKNVPELFRLRAPGNTCLSAAEIRMKNSMHGKNPDSYIKDHINNSKGCGGIMRTAPMSLISTDMTLEQTDIMAAELAAITHGNSLGFMPSAVLADIIQHLMDTDDPDDLRQIIINAKDTVRRLFPDDSNIDKLCGIIDLSVMLTENEDDDLTNIHRIGEGWVAEETLGIAIYCSLKYRRDLSKALIVSVNHNGDSDSTGAVTGNFLGTLVGFDNIDEKWKTDLEMSDVIISMADRLAEIR